MGGRGGAGGVSSRNTSSPDYKNSYNIEMENARSFEAAKSGFCDILRKSSGRM